MKCDCLWYVTPTILYTHLTDWFSIVKLSEKLVGTLACKPEPTMSPTLTASSGGHLFSRILLLVAIPWQN